MKNNKYELHKYSVARFRLSKNLHTPVNLVAEVYIIIIIKNEFKLASLIIGTGRGQRPTSYCRREGTRR